MLFLACDLRLDIQQHGCLLPSSYFRGCRRPLLALYFVYFVYLASWPYP